MSPSRFMDSFLDYSRRYNDPQCMQVNSRLRMMLSTSVPQWSKCLALRAAGCFGSVDSIRNRLPQSGHFRTRARPRYTVMTTANAAKNMRYKNSHSS